MLVVGCLQEEWISPYEAVLPPTAPSLLMSHPKQTVSFSRWKKYFNRASVGSVLTEVLPTEVLLL